MKIEFPARTFHTTAFKSEAERERAAGLDLSERHDMVDNLLVEHPSFRDGQEFLARFHLSSRKLNKVSRGRIGGIIGEFRSGKSILVQRYIQAYAPFVEPGGWRVPALMITAARVWDAKELARQVSRKTGRPPKSQGSVSDHNSIALDRMGMLGVGLLVIDEAHELLAKAATAASFWSFIKALVDDRICNVMLLGHQGLAEAVLERPEMKGRGNFPRFYVPSYNPRSEAGKAAYLLYLADVVDRLPFRKRSKLWEKPFIDSLLKTTDASRGVTMELLRPAAHHALDDGADCIELDHFRTALLDQAGSAHKENFK